MFHAKQHDEEDDELPRYEEEEGKKARNSLTETL